MNGWFVECLQCGYISDLDALLKARKELLAKKQDLLKPDRKNLLPNNHLF